jgi:hypothetical protein
MRHVWSAVCACLVGVSSSVASAQTVSDCEAQGKFLVTAYGFADNDPAYSDAIATVGQNSNWRANFSTTNTFDNPSTLAVPSSWLDGTGNFSEGDRVFVEGLGWFVVEDLCAGCTGNWIDVWTAFALPEQEANVTACRNVWVYNPGDTIPSSQLAASAGPEWLGATWSSRFNQRMTGSGTSQIYVNDLVAPRSPANWSERLVDGMEQQEDAGTTFINVYDSQPSWVHWSGYDGATLWEARTKCSTYLRELYRRAYDIPDQYMINWMGTASPFAEDWYARIQARDNFSAVARVTDIRRNDIIAIRYTGADATGHNAIVLGAPRARTASAPVIAGTVQYEVDIIDSTQSPHGSAADTRLDGKADGVGQGIMRLYADASTGNLLGYTWSVLGGSVYYGAGGDTSRTILIGRFQNLPDYQP